MNKEIPKSLSKREVLLHRRFRHVILAISLILALAGCGGLRYSEVDPEAGNFHPERIGILPVDVGPYEEARGTVDQIIAVVLSEKKWFTDIVSGNDIQRQLQENEELRKVTADYTAKLKAVNFSDPDLSRRIGEISRVDAFLVVSLDYWNYTTENEDKVGKVGLKIKMINAATGKVLWTAGHSKAEKYWLLKPELPNVARALFKEMVADMPR